MPDLAFVDPYAVANTTLSNPYAQYIQPPGPRDWKMSLGQSLANLGMGISMAGSQGRPWFAGIAPGAAMASNAMQADEDRRFKQGLAYGQFQQNEALRAAQAQEIGLKATQLKMDQDLQDKFLNGGGFNVPTTPGVQMGAGTYGNTVAAGESGGRYDIPNAKGSGAYGKYQFMPDTWASVATAHPDLKLPFDMRQATPQQQESAFQAFTQDNAKALQANGVAPTAENLYYAHRFGAGGAQQFLKADPNAQISSLFPRWIGQNPDLATTVGQFRQGAQSRFGATPVQYAQPQAPAGAPQLPGPPPDMSRFAPFMASPRLAPMINFGTAQQERQYNDAWKRYEAQRQIQNDARASANQDVIPDPNNPGQFIPNQPLIGAKKDISAAQGTDVGAYAQKQLIDQTVKEHQSIQSSALQAQTGLNQINRLSGLLDQLNTGKFTSSTTDIKATAKALGIDLGALGIADNVGPAQAATALANQFALQMRNPAQGAGMPGSLSDSDRRFLTEMIPSINATPEGNKLLTETMRKLYQRSIDTAKIANDWMREKGNLQNDPAGLYAKLSEYSNKNPLFSEEDAKKMTQGGEASPSPAPAAQKEDLYKRYNLKAAPQ